MGPLRQAQGARQAQVPIASYPAEPLAEPLAALLARRPESDPEVEDAVRDILRQVRAEGDAALCEMTRKFDGVEMGLGQLRVSASALAEAEAGLEPSLRESIEAAIANIRAFHERQKVNSWFMEDGDGVVLGKKITPIERVGLCVPAGEVPLFSSLLMTAVPAQVAGGSGTLRGFAAGGGRRGASDDCGGRASVGHCGGVRGGVGRRPWGPWPTGRSAFGGWIKSSARGRPIRWAAQRQVFGAVGIALLPGPSEIVVLADEGADPRLVGRGFAVASRARLGGGVCVHHGLRVLSALCARGTRSATSGPAAPFNYR